MSINLQEIRSAVQNYVDTKVTVSISALDPAQGEELIPNRQFTFSVTATNASAAVGGIALKNVRWHIWVENPAVAKLIVPMSPMVARQGLSSSLEPLVANTQVGEMYLFPPTDSAGNYLGTGDTDTISGLQGKAGPNPSGGNTTVWFEIYADPDLDYLLPKNQDTPNKSTPCVVHG